MKTSRRITPTYMIVSIRSIITPFTSYSANRSNTSNRSIQTSMSISHTSLKRVWMSNNPAKAYSSMVIISRIILTRQAQGAGWAPGYLGFYDNTKIATQHNKAYLSWYRLAITIIINLLLIIIVTYYY